MRKSDVSWKNTTFELKEEHLKLLSMAHVDWDDSEFGAPAINPKRPYGNSGVAYHIFEILEWDIEDDGEGLTDEEYDRAATLHSETQIALQIILQLRTFQPGLYRDVAPEPYRVRWEFVQSVAPLDPPSRAPAEKVPDENTELVRASLELVAAWDSDPTTGAYDDRVTAATLAFRRATSHFR